MTKYRDVSEYGVHLSINVVSGDTGEVIDFQSESEYYATYEEACAVAERYKMMLGEEICSWGSDAGILDDVWVDEEPRINRYFA